VRLHRITHTCNFDNFQANKPWIAPTLPSTLVNCRLVTTALSETNSQALKVFAFQEVGFKIRHLDTLLNPTDGTISHLPHLSAMDKVVGVLGGGQLGRMLTEAANRLNIKVVTLDKPSAPAKRLAAHGDHVDGSFKDAKAIGELAAKCDVLTIEIEHVDVDVLRELQEDPDVAENVSIEPSWKTIETIQDKYRQKLHLQDEGVKTADSFRLEDPEHELGRVAELFGYPFMLKARRDAYDGRGNFKVGSEKDFKPALDFLGDRSLYAEKFAPFKMELAVVVARTKNGALPFPVVETVHENSICKLVYSPPRGASAAVCQAAQDLAVKAVKTFQGKGVYAVEMFLLADDSLLVNEV
jgi:phosphoribosylaminoimidazole carboxylase